LREQESANYARNNRDTGAASERAQKFRCRRGREPSEKAAGQPAAIVDHDPCDEQASDGLIWNHSIFYHSRGHRDNQSITG
jgi:hypothetical protein